MAAISFGEVPSNFRSEDFRMGKPHLVKPNDRALFEGLVLTQGSETSQYLEEKKTIVIPLVAASEKGEAQTVCSNTSGVVSSKRSITRRVTKHFINRTGWKAGPQKVIVL